MLSTNLNDAQLELPPSEPERCFVLKKTGFDNQAEKYVEYIINFLGIKGIKRIRSGVRYDVEGISNQEFQSAKYQVFAEAPSDHLLDESDFNKWFGGEEVIMIESLPGQYDQRADCASQCLQLISSGNPKVKVANFITILGTLSPEDLSKIKKALINPVDSREASKSKPTTLDEILANPKKVEIINHFTNLTEEGLKTLLLPTSQCGLALAMTFEDLKNVQKYFQQKNRQPTITELKVIDMYWSDHCRHTTFTTQIENVVIDGYKMYSEGLPDIYRNSSFNHVTSSYARKIAGSIYDFLKTTKYSEKTSGFSLMDIATQHAKELKEKTKNPHSINRSNSGIQLEASTENNAASIIVPVTFEDGHSEEWLYMFKNETHNHPTEIEPVGGAATCLGGAIRDPLSGRSYVFMGMRVSGAADIHKSFSETLPGKLPQRYISQKAAEGFAGYGNQIGVPTLQVKEFYHSGFEAKRLEVGFVGAAVPLGNVIRENPQPGDQIILLGGRTGRDGIGGATGSSKIHDETSTSTAGAEVQKGNPPEERKIQRLFRNSSASKLIKKCNDFGAGGVANAIGELAPGLTINLDQIPLKYSGLDGTEIALSESQERMAVVIKPEDVSTFIELARAENLEATIVASVNESAKLNITCQGEAICSLDRDFLEGGWAKRSVSINANIPKVPFYRAMRFTDTERTFKQLWFDNLGRFNNASQKGLQMRFDSTVGANTIIGPFGGLNQDTPADAVIAKFPVEGAKTAVAASIGYNPDLAKHSPYEAGYYAVIESVSKLIASGVDPQKITLTFQNYFEKLGQEPDRWGKVFMAQLGAWAACKLLEIAPIGGKDSMSGSFVNSENGSRIDVPPSLISFATGTIEKDKTIPNFFQEAGNIIVIYDPYTGLGDCQFPNDIGPSQFPNDLGDYAQSSISGIHQLMQKGIIKSCKAISNGGLAQAICEMSFGQEFGAFFSRDFPQQEWFIPRYGQLVLEISPDDCEELQNMVSDSNLEFIGQVKKEFQIKIHQGGKVTNLDLAELRDMWQNAHENIYPTTTTLSTDKPLLDFDTQKPRTLSKSYSGAKLGAPKVLLPVFPGTNCEFETAAAFQKAGAETWESIFRNISPEQLQESILELAQKIRQSQILVLSGGFSAGDEPDGSGKFISNVLRNPHIRDAVEDLRDRDGLILGICNGFQALVKSCLLPNGQIGIQNNESLTLTHNHIGHYVSMISNHQVTSKLSPWLNYLQEGDIWQFPIAHGEGRIVASNEQIQNLWSKQQIPFRYVDDKQQPATNFPHNPNGSKEAIAGLTTEDGKILGMMAHPERARENLQKNIPGLRKGMSIFNAGVDYFTGKETTK